MMEAHRIKPTKPRIQLKLDWDDLEALISMLYEAKAYAADCGETTQRHQMFIDVLDEVLIDAK
jgi:hypothetical protein